MFCSNPYRGSIRPEQQSGIAKLLPWELHLVSQHQVIIVLNCISDHLLYLKLFCASSARCFMVLEKPKRVYFLRLETLQKFSIEINGNCFFTLYHFSLGEVSLNTLLSDSGGNLYIIYHIYLSSISPLEICNDHSLFP